MASLADRLGHLGRRIETHASWVFVGDEFVFKFKKPVDFGFLDFSTMEKRRAACEAEVRLNSRLAPHVYLGVVDVRRAGDECYVDDRDAPGQMPAHERGQLVDSGVKMRRLRDEDRADTLVTEGCLELEQVDALARVVADFHARCAHTPEITKWGRREVIQANIDENFEQTREVIDRYVEREIAREIERKQHAFLEANGQAFDRRIEGGFIRDGHGDLRLDHSYFCGDEVVIIDCIEFNDRFRYADTCADLSFLAMDLRHRGRPDFAERLLSEYALRSRDYELFRLVDFYESYRAFVRGKVTILRLQQEEGGNLAAAKEATRYFRHALDVLNPAARRPQMVVFCGMIGSGKSTVAERARRRTSAVLIDSDRTRKHLAGLRVDAMVHDGPYEGLYSREMTQRVHEEMERCAEIVLGSGRSLFIEATFSKRSDRARLSHLAERCGADLALVECWVSPEEAKRRLVERAKTPNVSDGRLGIYDELARGYESIEPGEFDRWVRLDTQLSEAAQCKLLEQVDLPAH